MKSSIRKDDISWSASDRQYSGGTDLQTTGWVYWNSYHLMDSGGADLRKFI